MADKTKESSKPVLFTRQSTGLVKSVSAIDVLIYTLSCAGPIVLIALGVTTLPSIYEGVNLPLVFGLSIILLITLAYNTICLSATLPRAGGDYVFGSRIVNPIWGMIPSFMVEFSFVVGIASLAIVALEAFIGPAILTSYPQYAAGVSTWIYGSPANIALLAVLIIAVIFGLAAVGTKKWFWLIRVLAIYALIMTLVFFGYLATANRQTIINNYNAQAVTPLNYSAVVSNATATGWPQSVSPTVLSTAGAMIFLFFFMAAPISAYFAGEIKNTQRSMTIGLMGGTILAWTVAAVGILGFLAVFGYTFMSDFGFLGSLNGPTASLGVFTFNTLLLALVNNPNITFLIGMGFGLAMIAFLSVTLLPASRILFAWSFDRLIPERFSSVSSRTQTPVFSIAFVGALTAVVAVIDAYYSAALGEVLATTLIVAIAFMPNGFTAAILPFHKKDIYNTAPPIARKKIGGLPLITLTGLVQGVGLVIIIILTFLEPAASGTSTGTISIGAIAVVLFGLIASILFYPISKAIRKSQGLDLSLVFNEIPPE